MTERARHAAAEALHEALYGDTDGLYGNATFAANAAIDAYIAARREEWFVEVPREPSEATVAQLSAFFDSETKDTAARLARDIYRAMLKAAEQHTGEK
jgi:hypothetical protein